MKKYLSVVAALLLTVVVTYGVVFWHTYYNVDDDEYFTIYNVKNIIVSDDEIHLVDKRDNHHLVNSYNDVVKYMVSSPKIIESTEPDAHESYRLVIQMKELKSLFN